MKSLKGKILIGSAVLVILFVVLFVAIPYFIAGPPTPLFTARNHDSEVHELRVGVFDSGNNSVLDETYELTPDERISHPKSFRFRVPGFEIVDYTFKFTLDGRFTETYSTSVRPWNTVEVELYADYAEGRPLSVGEITV